MPPFVDLGFADAAANNVHLEIELLHLAECELLRPVFAQPVIVFLVVDIVYADSGSEQSLAPALAYPPQLGLQVALDQSGGQSREKVRLVGGDQDVDNSNRLGRLGRAHALLEGQENFVEVVGRGGEVLVQRGGVEHEDDSAETVLGHEAVHGEVAQLSVAWGIDEQELLVLAGRIVLDGLAKRQVLVDRGGQFDRLGDLRAVGGGRDISALEQGLQGRLASTRGTDEDDGGEVRVRCRAAHKDVDNDGHKEDDQGADDEDGGRRRQDVLDVLD